MWLGMQWLTVDFEKLQPRKKEKRNRTKLCDSKCVIFGLVGSPSSCFLYFYIHDLICLGQQRER